MIEKQFFLNEIKGMTDAILNGKLGSGSSKRDHVLIGSINESFKEKCSDFNYPIRQLAENLAINDLKQIQAALEILYTYEKAGVKFDFINHKTQI